jgi:hypothetical protein
MKIYKNKMPAIEDFVKSINTNLNIMKNRASQDAVVTQGTTIPALYFITETFKEVPKSSKQRPDSRFDTAYTYMEPKDLLDITGRWHAKFYKHILNQTVPSNHYPSRKAAYPIAYSFIDLSGSKFNHNSFLKMPHVHSIFIVPPKTLGRFKSLISDEFRIEEKYPKTNNIKTFDCQRIKIDDDDLYRVIEYSSKFYRSSYAKMFSEEIRSNIFTMHGKSA